MKLSVGISHIRPDWEIPLRQIGIPYYPVDTGRAIEKEETPVLILASGEKRENSANILNYLQSGGAILTEADTARTVLDISTKKLPIRYLFSSEDKIFSGIPICDMQPGRREVAVEAGHLKNQDGKHAAAILHLGEGMAIVLPSGFSLGLLSTEVKRKNFPAAGGERLPSERISLVSKGSIRQIIQKALEHLFHFRGLPFVHLWHLPYSWQTLFGFRVDTDFGDRAEVEELYTVCRNHDIRAAWFVETQSQADWVNFYREMENQEIAYHCYRHRVFSDYRKNLKDLQTGLKILQDAGIDPRGYAAPFGEWHPLLGKIVEEMGFNYSSEFAAAYDDLPFYPYLDDSFSTVLQVPVHPVSVGRLRWARHTSEQMLAYFLREIDCKSSRFEPIFLYHHPGHQNFQVFEKIFLEIKQRNIPTMSMGEYAEWWRQRSNIQWEASYVNNQLTVHSDFKNNSVRIRRCEPSGKSILMPINRDETKTEEFTLPVNLNHSMQWDPKQLRKYTWRMLVNDLFWTYGKLKR